MKIEFPIKDVCIRQVNDIRRVKEPAYSDRYWQMNQHEFAMQVEGVGNFYARDGKEAEYSPAQEATIESLELYLNGSVYGAILHQRQILPMHGSSFLYRGMGVMICGETGAGKSALTASFCLDGAAFLTDDVTPLLFRDGVPYIMALSARIKLWGDTLRQLGQAEAGLHRIDPETDKYYFPMDAVTGDNYRLDHVYIIEIRESAGVEFEELSGAETFIALRNEIYRIEYLQGMPDNEKVYFSNLVGLSNNVNVVRVKRPAKIPVKELMIQVMEHGAWGMQGAKRRSPAKREGMEHGEWGR